MEDKQQLMAVWYDSRLRCEGSPVQNPTDASYEVFLSVICKKEFYYVNLSEFTFHSFENCFRIMFFICKKI